MIATRNFQSPETLAVAGAAGAKSSSAPNEDLASNSQTGRDAVWFFEQEKKIAREQLLNLGTKQATSNKASVRF